MNIGKTKKTGVAEPIVVPVPKRVTVPKEPPQSKPDKTPIRKEEPVPSKR